MEARPGARQNPDGKDWTEPEERGRIFCLSGGHFCHECLTRTLEWDNKSQGRSAGHLRLVQRAKNNG
jgi:hypothetical protein